MIGEQSTWVLLIDKVGVPLALVLILMVGFWRGAHAVAPTFKSWVDLVLNRWMESTRARDAMDLRIIEHQYKLGSDAQDRHLEAMKSGDDNAKEARHAIKNIPHITHGLLGPEFESLRSEIRNQAQRTRAVITHQIEETGDLEEP